MSTGPSAHWVRFRSAGAVHFGTLERGSSGERVRVCQGDLFGSPVPTERTLALAEVELLAPVVPGKIIALWNNFHALGARLGLAEPAEPLYLLKAPTSVLAPGGVIRQPRAAGKVVFEGELAIVIGKTASGVSPARALEHVLGYTCANDVTQADILHRDPSFPQWARAKSFDTFCPFGPAIATGIDPATLVVRTLLDGEVRQDYPVSDMRFGAAQLVSLVSQDMTLEPGDLILCGTSVGVGSMRPGSTVEVEIAGVGRLTNQFQ